jgi:hypothetical protein
MALFPLLLFGNIGHITMKKGDVKILRGNTTIIGNLGSELENHDIVLTYNGGKAQLTFKDNTIVSVGKNARFSIEDYLFEEGSSDAKLEMKASRGFFKMVSGEIGKVAQNRFKVKTVTATMGIRGTQFYGEITDDGDIIGCTQGQITVTSNDVEKMIVVDAGLMTFVAAGVAPTSPEPIVVDPTASDSVSTSTQESTEDTEASDTAQETSSDAVTQQSEQVASTIISKEVTNAQTPPTPDGPASTRAFKEVSSSNEGYWGYWLNAPSTEVVPSNVSGSYIKGNITPEQNVDYLMDKNAKARYASDNVIGTVNDAGSKTLLQNGNVDMTIDFGNSKIESGTLSFEETTGAKWGVDMKNGTVTNSGFSASGSDVTTATTSDIKEISGSMDGKFYGDQAQEVGATFNLSSGTKSVEGAFQGAKQ